MKHVNLQTLATLYNVVKEGGNHRYNYIETSSDNYTDERKDFISLVRTHGYDILTPGDFRFSEKVMEYNRVMELQAKSEGFTSYDKYNFDELCVCGQWIFTDKQHSFSSEEVEISDNRGGRREGAGRKSKNSALATTETAVIRVPKYNKDEIKNLVAWLVEKASEGTDVKCALFSAVCRFKSEDEESAEAKLLEELYSKLPNFYVNKTTEILHD